MTEARINEAREQYRPAACRAALLYFTMNELQAIHPMYHFSLKVPALSLWGSSNGNCSQCHRITQGFSWKGLKPILFHPCLGRDLPLSLSRKSCSFNILLNGKLFFLSYKEVFGGDGGLNVHPGLLPNNFLP